MIQQSLLPLAIALLLGGASVARAACPSEPTASRFTPNGAEVIDQKTGLVWARCNVGQAWSGSTCTGTVSTHTYEQALSLAQATSGWRLPNVKELASIADKGCQNPAIDSAAFPATLSTGYWSSSPFVGNAYGAWSVVFYDGYVQGYNRDVSAPVRLVRASQ